MRRLDWLEIQSSGKRLDLYFTGWLTIQTPAKSSFISPYTQGILVLADFLERWQFGPLWKREKKRPVGSFSEVATLALF